MLDGIIIDCTDGSEYDAVILPGDSLGDWLKVAVRADRVITPTLLINAATMHSPSGRFHLIVPTEA